MHRRLVYIYLLNVPSFSSRYFNKIKRTSRLGRLLALSLEILMNNVCVWCLSYEYIDGAHGIGVQNVTSNCNVKFFFLLLIFR